MKMSITLDGNNVTLSWDGGQAPFQLQKCDALSDNPNWYLVGNPTLARTSAQPLVGEQGYFRVQEQVALLKGEVSGYDILLTWIAPDLAE